MKPVFVTAHAEIQILDLDLWWTANRDKAPNLFEEELRSTFDLLSGVGSAGKRWRQPTVPNVRRLRLPKTGFFVYYVDMPDHVRVLALWGGVRVEPPDLGPG